MNPVPAPRAPRPGRMVRPDGPVWGAIVTTGFLLTVDVALFLWAVSL